MRESYNGPRFPDGPPREARFLRAVGRLKPGLSLEAAEDRMEVLAARLAADHPRTNAGWSVQLVPLRDELVRSSRTELLLVFGAVFCLLLLVCANVASLAIARSAARAREMAIRLALGAGRTRIVREHLAETALCAVLTAFVAIVFTTVSLGAAIAFAPADIPRLNEVEVNASVVWFAIALAFLVTIIGVLPSGPSRQFHRDRLDAERRRTGLRPERRAGCGARSSSLKSPSPWCCSSAPDCWPGVSPACSASIPASTCRTCWCCASRPM